MIELGLTDAEIPNVPEAFKRSVRFHVKQADDAARADAPPPKPPPRRRRPMPPPLEPDPPPSPTPADLKRLAEFDALLDELFDGPRPAPLADVRL